MKPTADADILERILETTRDAVIFIDGDANIVRFNPAAAQMFGYEPSEVLGRRVEMLMSEQHADEHASYIRRYEQTGRPRAIGRIRTVMGRRADGERFPLELSVTEVGHERVRYAALLRDISDRARVQDNERLAKVGLLASMFAHEVGNPLNNMFIHTQLLQRKIAREQLEAQLGSSVGLILDELRRLNQLLYEFRELYQPTPTSRGPVSMVVLLDDILRGLVSDPGLPIELHTTLEPGLPPAHGHTDKLRQVFLNLCKNAVEAMPAGGRLVTRACTRDSRVIVEIEDSGPGIPDGIDPFEPFHTTKAQGSGLGLAVARQIVTDHEGEISYASQPGRGTTFTVALHVAT